MSPDLVSSMAVAEEAAMRLLRRADDTVTLAAGRGRDGRIVADHTPV